MQCRALIRTTNKQIIEHKEIPLSSSPQRLMRYDTSTAVTNPPKDTSYQGHISIIQTHINRPTCSLSETVNSINETERNQGPVPSQSILKQ